MQGLNKKDYMFFRALFALNICKLGILFFVIFMISCMFNYFLTGYIIFQYFGLVLALINLVFLFGFLKFLRYLNKNFGVIK